MAQNLLGAIAERLRATAHVDTLYGESRTVEGRTIIPVARVMYGFGGGAGEAESPQAASGGGGGGGVMAHPLGFLVVDSLGERFVSVSPSRRRLMAACSFGFALGLLVSRLRRR